MKNADLSQARRSVPCGYRHHLRGYAMKVPAQKSCGTAAPRLNFWALVSSP